MAQNVRKKSTKTTGGNAKSKKAAAAKSKKNAAAGAVCTIIAGAFFAMCSYFPQLCGVCGYAVKSFVIYLFGAAGAVFPIVLTALGIYLQIKKDIKKFSVKAIFSFISMFLLCGLFYIFGQSRVKMLSLNPGRFSSAGCGILGIPTKYLTGVCGDVLCAIVYILLIVCFCSLIFKISFFRLIAGFVETTKEEADEVKKQQAYETGRKARKKVSNAAHALRPLKNHKIDFEVSDIEDKEEVLSEKRKENADKRKKEEETAKKTEEEIEKSSDIGDIDVPFDIHIANESEHKEDIAEEEMKEECTGDILHEISEDEFNDKFAANSSEEDDYEDDDFDDIHDAPPADIKPEEPEKQEIGKDFRKQLEDSVLKEPIPYKIPPLNLLSGAPEKKNSDMREELRETANKLVSTLKSFGVEVKLSQVSCGPAVTRFELQPSVGVKVSKITNLADDIALNLAATAVRIEAPIPGKAAIGIEIPNKEVSTVSLKEVIESQEFKNAPSKLAVALGIDITGKPVIGDIAKMPHVLIAGATGSGKSVCINSIVTSILYKADPNEVKLIMVDPKKVELDVYNGIPHLLIPVVTEPKKASGALNWAVSEMLKRYDMFALNGVRNLKGYNEAMALEGKEKLPQIVIIVDELSDLMMAAPKEVEDSICRLAQMARAAGMHLIIATQRPSVNVITGVIKANIPSRIAFAVSSQIDSRTILDGSGAEKLLGKGDMLFMPMGASKPKRLQGAFVSDKEVEAVVEFVKGNSQARYDEDITEKINSETEVEQDMGDCDELLPKAIEIAVSLGNISTSMVQRRLGVGYARAGRIIDQMEHRGIISGADGSKPRNVLITKDDL